MRDIRCLFNASIHTVLASKMELHPNQKEEKKTTTTKIKQKLIINFTALHTMDTLIYWLVDWKIWFGLSHVRVHSTIHKNNSVYERFSFCLSVFFPFIHSKWFDFVWEKRHISLSYIVTHSFNEKSTFIKISNLHYFYQISQIKAASLNITITITIWNAWSIFQKLWQFQSVRFSSCCCCYYWLYWMNIYYSNDKIMLLFCLRRPNINRTERLVDR